MSSILTNTSAMVALQSLQTINDQLNTVQNQISTGKTVSTAADNAAVWAISTQMNSDVTGFTGISNSLSLGKSTVAVASQAASSITDLLTTMKSKIVAAQDGNADRTSLNNDITALKNQIGQVVTAAQFNGVNLVDGSQGASTQVLSALNRDQAGNVTASYITITNQDLSTGGYTAAAVFTAPTSGTAPSTNGDTVGFTLDNGSGTDSIVLDGSVLAAGDQVSINIGGQTAAYTVTAADVASTTPSDMVAVGLKNAIDKLGISGLTVDYNSANSGELDFTNAGTTDLTVSGQYRNAGSGGLAAMSSISVTSAGGATSALATIETLLSTAITATSAFGTASTQITSQSTFIGNLTDTLKNGIGTLVDADMEAASAKLQALQVQQQLGIQALSIANKAPQNLLALFR